VIAVGYVKICVFNTLTPELPLDEKNANFRLVRAGTLLGANRSNFLIY